MLRVFLSSTSKDLENFRELILDALNESIDGVGMENFIPNGNYSQDVSIREIRKSDIVIFLITPFYGTLLNECNIEDCKAENCPLKIKNEPISYTHCEYKVTEAEGILHQSYFIPEYSKVKTTSTISNEINIEDKVKQFLEEVGKENYFKIQNIEDTGIVNTITDHLVNNIVEWYSKGQLKLEDFYNRRSSIAYLMNNLDESIEVYGVGGIGKTSLIQVILLLQKLRGKQIIALGPRQFYITGSGYKIFKNKCRDVYHRVFRNEIILDDVIDALSRYIPDTNELKQEVKEIKFKKISELIEKREVHLLIDDFHLADSDVRNLVKYLDFVICSSRKSIGNTRRIHHLKGLDEVDRIDYIEMLSERFHKNISDSNKEKISNITEGHPISMELIVRNYDHINVDKMEIFDPNIILNVDSEKTEEYLNRIVMEILSDEEYELLKNLSIINSDIENNINKRVIETLYQDNDFESSFKKLINAGFLKKKDIQEEAYEFIYDHIKESLGLDVDTISHQLAVNYYNKKKEIYGENPEDFTELMYHNSLLETTEDLALNFLSIENPELLKQYSLNKLVTLGKKLKEFFEGELKAKIYYQLGIFYYTTRRYSKAEDSYNEALKIYLNLEELSPNLYQDNIADVHDKLGTLCMKLRRYDKAEDFHNLALSAKLNLVKKEPNIFLPHLAWTYGNLGLLYKAKKSYKMSENSFKRALEIRKELTLTDRNDYLADLAWTRGNLGLLFNQIQMKKKAQKEFLKALKIREKLAERDPETYLSDLAWIQNNLGAIYKKLKKYEFAKEMHLKALKIYEDLSIKNPEYYLYYKAWTWDQLALLFINLKDFDESERLFKESLKIKKLLSKSKPFKIDKSIFWSHRNLGTLYSKSKKFEEAEESFLKALSKAQKLALYYPDLFENNVADIQNRLGNFYRGLNKPFEAENAYKEALKINLKLSKKNPELFLYYVDTTYNDLAKIYLNQNKLKDAEICFLTAKKVRKRLAFRYPEIFLHYVEIYTDQLGKFYMDLNHYDKAIRAKLLDLKIYQRIAEINPKIFFPRLAKVKKELGSLYNKLDKFNEAEEALFKSKKDYEELADFNPEFYLISLAKVHLVLSHLYFKFNLKNEALISNHNAIEVFKQAKIYKKCSKYLACLHHERALIQSEFKKFMSTKRNFALALDYILDLEEDNPGKQLKYINDIFDDIRLFYQNFDKLEMVKITPMISVDLIDFPSVSNSYLYREELMKIENYVGLSFEDLGIYDKAEKMYLKALNNNDKLINIKSKIQLKFKAIIKSNLGYLYRKIGRLNLSKTIFNEVLELNKELEKIDPKKYRRFVHKTERILQELSRE